MGERLDPGVELRHETAALKHAVPLACTFGVMLRDEAEKTQSYTGRPALRWRGRLDPHGCHILDILAEDHRKADPPHVIAFHSQPLDPPGARRGRANRRR